MDTQNQPVETPNQPATPTTPTPTTPEAAK